MKEGNIGRVSLAVVDGNPAITYYSTSSYDLMYARSATATGADPDDWNIITIDSEGFAGSENHLAFIGGYPVICYISDYGLQFARATTNTGANPADWELLTLDPIANVKSISISCIDSNPAVSYMGANKVKYARARNSIGADFSDWRFCTIDDSAVVYQYTSLAVIDSRPAVAFYNQGTEDLMFAWADNSTGTSSSDWRQPVTVDSLGDVGKCLSLADVNGHPAIAYIDDSESEHLKYAIWF